MTAEGLGIMPPMDLRENNYAWSFEIETTKEQHEPKSIQTDASKALKGTKKVDLEDKQ